MEYHRRLRPSAGESRPCVLHSGLFPRCYRMIHNPNMPRLCAAAVSFGRGRLVSRGAGYDTFSLGEVDAMMTATQVRVLLVEDHALVREGTRALIEVGGSITVVGETDTADEAVRLATELSPDVVLLDIRLRIGTGIDVARALHKQRSPARILVLTAYDFEQYVTALTRAGVSGYILKNSPSGELVKAIHQVHQGGGVLAGNIAATVLRSLSKVQSAPSKVPEALTVREVEVLELVMQEYRNPAIGERLGISPRTVESHVANILGKLGASTRKEAVQIAVEQGHLKSQHG